MDRLMSEPNYEDLMQAVNKQNRFAIAPEGYEETTQRLRELEAFKGKQAIQNMTNVKQWKKGGYGFIEDRKPDNMVRLILESYNNLQYFTDKKKRTKIHTIDHTRKRLQGDLQAGVEPGTDWIIARQQGGDSFHDLFGMGEDKKSVCAHNSTEQAAKSQYGGTCMMAFGVFSSHVEKPSLDPDKGVDRRGLGSYCSLVTTGKTAKPVRIVTYYRPNDESRHRTPKKGRQTVFSQHIREFKRQGMLDKDPRLEADRCLIEDLKKWKANGEELILLGDFNQSIYKSRLADELTGPDLEMEEQFRRLHGTEAPHSYVKGKLPITGCFATKGVEAKAYFISDHHAYGSLGDHRLHVIDFSSQSIIGDNLPRVTKRSGRKLQWKV